MTQQPAEREGWLERAVRDHAAWLDKAAREALETISRLHVEGYAAIVHDEPEPETRPQRKPTN
jgi:hypothetical protein